MKSAKKYKVGFIGLGIMGKPMVLNLIKNNFEVYFFARKKNIIDEVVTAGGIFISAIEEIPNYTSLSITNLPNTKDVKQTVIGKKGLINNIKRGYVVIDMSTISPQGAREINASLNTKNSYFIDAPVSGGEAGAISGVLSIMVGGDKKIYQKIKYVLTAIGKKITYIGDSGSGQVCKACNQILVAQTIQSISEIINIAKKSNIDPKLIREALLAGYANSKILDIHGMRMINSDFNPGFKLSLHHKDLKIAKNLTKHLNINIKGLNHVKKLMKLAEQEDLSDLDSSAIHKILEKIHN
jgi:2-hydroxy-3-oxopropionate reductase